MDTMATEKQWIWSRLKQDDGYRMRFLHTVFVMWMFIILGWTVSVVGSTFPDLRLIMDKDLDTASWFFTLGGLGYLVGALFGGVLFDRVNRLIMMSATVTLSGVAIACMPWCTNFPLMLFANFMSGIFTGGIDVCGNSHVASIWGRKAAPYMQMVHFGFSFGGIISPLTADPFLAEKYCAEKTGNSSVENSIITAKSVLIYPTTNASISNITNCEEMFGKTNIHYAYLITGILSLSSAAPFIVLYFMSSKHNTYVDSVIDSVEEMVSQKANGDLKNTDEEQIKKKVDETGLPDLSLSTKIMFVTLLMVLISLYASAEGRFSSFLTTFVTERLSWSTSEGLHVTSVFWGTFAAGRLIGILVTKFLRPATMVAVYLIALTMSFIGFFFATMYELNTLIWVFSALAGLFMSVIFPSIFTWTAESILNVTGTISAVYLVGVSVGNMLFPLLYGYLMDNFTQMYFVDLLIAQGATCFVIYVIIRIQIGIFITPLRQHADTTVNDIACILC